MSTELKNVKSREKAGVETELFMTRFWGGDADGVCVQLTENVFRSEPGRGHFNQLQLTKAQALELAAALVEFANDEREEMLD